jgi:hypothetical protein
MGSQPTPKYHYDIFVSVKRDLVFGDWLRTYFLPLFIAYLKQEVIVKCKRQFEGYFFYEKALRPGDAWPEELRLAIKTSRVGVALCSPEYFFSDWCLTELHSFLKRDKKVLVPVSIYDGEAFPKEVQEIQKSDLSQYVIVGEGYVKTARYVDFQDKLRELSRDVAVRISEAPLYSDWPIEDKTAPPGEPDIPQQRLES